MKIYAIKIIFTSILCLLFMSSNHIALAKILTYQVQIDKNNPYRASIVVDTSSLQTFEIVPARSMMQIEKSKLMLKCDEKKDIILDKPLTLQCNQISWEIPFRAYDANNEDIAQQKNLFIAHPQALWILTEWDSLPRFTNHEQALVCMDDGIISRCQALPPGQSPPLIMPFGHQQSSYKFKNIDISLFSNIDAQYEQNVLKKYDAIVTYLASIIPNSPDKKMWDLIWLAAEKSLGLMGGAAGHASFIANYPVENGQWTEQSEKWLLKISAHEAFHVLSQLNAPLWVEESLAEYYAFKSLNTLNIASSTPLQSFLKNKSTLPHATSSLYYAHKYLSAVQKDMSFYPLIYIKGSAFWYEVDMALQAKNKNLDGYIKHLEGLNFIAGKLPKTFEAMIQRDMTAQVWEKIKQKYLSD